MIAKFVGNSPPGAKPVKCAMQTFCSTLEGKDLTTCQQLHTIISVNAGIAVAP
jgi:hypothetical protein